MSEWREMELGELCQIKGGKRLPKGEQLSETPTDHPYIRTRDLANNKIAIQDLLFVPNEVFPKISRYIVEEGDIIISIVGTIGLVARIPRELHLASLTENCAKLVQINEEVLCKEFLFYFLISSDGQDEIDQRNVGSTQPKLPLYNIKSIPIPIPPLEEQKSIASVLSSLDDKIDLLHRQNQTLEQMAETLFRQWFLPAGRHGVEEADEGWEVKKLRELVDIGIGRTPPRKEFHWFSKSISDVKWVSIKDLGDSGVFVLDTSEYLTEEAVEKFNIPIIPPDTVLLSFKMTLGRVAITTEHMLSNEAIAHFKFNDDTPFSKEFLYFYLKTYPYETLGSTSSIVTSINSGMIKDMEAIIPDDETLTKFENQVIDYFDKIKSNQKQIRNLSALRDTLLPKLMSGEVRVNHQKSMEA